MALADMVGEMNAASMRMLSNATATWQPSNGGSAQSAAVIFNIEDREDPLSEMAVIGRHHAITYLNTNLVGLDTGESITIAGIGYTVREVMQIDDAMMQATLGTYAGA